MATSTFNRQHPSRSPPRSSKPEDIAQALKFFEEKYRLNHLLGDDPETIVEALTKENTPWSEKTLETLKSMSPTSLKVTLEQLRRGRKMDFASCLRMEYNMVQEFLQCVFLRTPDFHKGVTSLLIEKRKPFWNPTWTEMTDSIPRQLIQDAYFTPQTPKPSTRGPNARLLKSALEFLNDRTYFEYPHRTLSSFPREQDIKRVIEGKMRRGTTNAKPTKDEHIVDLFIQQWVSHDKDLMGTNVGKLPVEITIENGFGRGKNPHSAICSITAKSISSYSPSLIIGRLDNRGGYIRTPRLAAM
ncbi:hypothetical protein HDV05_004601 [Chytridiales sp. JEL 0842]|nr:hypothetical protein HDV05_004601 [Chytridiales sp. JEL 0842]